MELPNRKRFKGGSEAEFSSVHDLTDESHVVDLVDETRGSDSDDFSREPCKGKRKRKRDRTSYECNSILQVEHDSHILLERFDSLGREASPLVLLLRKRVCASLEKMIQYPNGEACRVSAVGFEESKGDPVQTNGRDCGVFAILADRLKRKGESQTEVTNYFAALALDTQTKNRMVREVRNKVAKRRGWLSSDEIDRCIAAESRDEESRDESRNDWGFAGVFSPGETEFLVGRTRRLLLGQIVKRVGAVVNTEEGAGVHWEHLTISIVPLALSEVEAPPISVEDDVVVLEDGAAGAIHATGPVAAASAQPRSSSAMSSRTEESSDCSSSRPASPDLLADLRRPVPVPVPASPSALAKWSQSRGSAMQCSSSVGASTTAECAQTNNADCVNELNRHVKLSPNLSGYLSNKTGKAISATKKAISATKEAISASASSSFSALLGGAKKGTGKFFTR